ncbi:hypothetical protein SESBI_48632 [Sesbania bispinosa]|nr:hypothetical protein SESBI_48632 [Sesbania bispinosa]
MELPHVPRAENKYADAPATIAKCGWMKPLTNFPREGVLPLEIKEAYRIKKKAEIYSLQGDKLFKKTITSDMLVCLNEDEQQKVMVEVQGGVYDGHQGGISLSEELSRLAIFCQRCGKTLLNS